MRYRVNDLPPRGAGAFMPLPTTNAPASSYGLVHVTGAPGTDPASTPGPNRTWMPSLTARGGVDSAQGSTVSPDVMLPAVYIPWTANMGPAADAGVGMTVRRRNPMPVPAVSHLRAPVVAFGTPRIGGRGVAAWPRTFQRFPVQTCPNP